GRAHGGLGADIAAATRPVVDHELLSEPLRQPLSDQARRDVGRAGRGEWYDQTHRPRRIGLRPRCARYSRERGSTRYQMQKISAGKFHLNLPLASPYSITDVACCARAARGHAAAPPSVAKNSRRPM